MYRPTRPTLLALLLLTAFLTLSGFTGCQKAPEDRQLEVYLVEAPDPNKAIEVRDGKLLFTDQDIESFDWKNQELILTEACLNRLHPDGLSTSPDPETSPLLQGGSAILGARFNDRFVVAIDGKALYDGYFLQPAYSSYCPVGVMILDTDKGFSLYNRSVDSEPRFNARIKALLERRNLLRSE